MKASILMIDDDPEFLEQCASAVQSAGFDCELCESAEIAHDRFVRNMYDGIVCDILIPFQGMREGGILLAREFSVKHPSSCLVLVSKFVTAKWVNQFAKFPNHAFVEKGENVTEDLVHELSRIAKTQSAFVCMPYAKDFDDYFEAGIKPTVQECGFKCIRADELEHNKGVIQIVYDQIQSAHIVIADMTGGNANVYYEVGYAHALGKEVVLLTQDADDLPFDLRGFNHIVYDGRISVLKEKLGHRLHAIAQKTSGVN